MIEESQFVVLKQMAACFAGQFGSNCEVVIHELEQDVHTSKIVHIENGHVSERKQGGGPSPVVLEALKKDPAQFKDRLSYLAKAHDGRILKSSTLYIRNANGVVVAIFAVNYDITSFLGFEVALASFVEPLETESKRDPMAIPSNVNELLDDLIEQSVKLIGKPATLMTKDEKIRAIQFLNNTGAFLVTKSGDKISEIFGISKYTMYSYIEAGTCSDSV